jgi:hypothetical protein
MIVLVTGGREYRNTKRLFAVLDRFHAERQFTFLIHGDAAGADHMAHRWCKRRGVQPVAMEALWDTDGNSAGSRRNKRMLDFAKPDLCIAFPGGRGTANMMRLCHEAGVELIDEEDLK